MARTTYANHTAAELDTADVQASERRDRAADAADAARDALRTALDRRRAMRRSGVRAEPEPRYLLTETQLMRRAADAAALTMRGEAFSPEDRRDCAAELVWHVLASMPGGGLPMADDRRADLSTLRGMAQNYRRALLRRRAAEQRVKDERHVETAADRTADAAAERLADVELAAQDAREYAAAAADLACKRLDMAAGAAVWSVFYEWARGESGATCAAELGVNPATWRDRTRNASIAIRLAYPGTAGIRDMLNTLVGGYSGTAADGAVIYCTADERTIGYRAPGKLTPPERSGTASVGTAADVRPERPEDAEQARAVCAVRHTYRRPLTRKLARRGMWASVRVTADGRRMMWRKPRRSKLEVIALARRDAATAVRRPGARERAVHYRKPGAPE